MSKTTLEKIHEDELDHNVVVEIGRYACISILFLIYAAVFALCQLVPHASAQLVTSLIYFAKSETID